MFWKAKYNVCIECGVHFQPVDEKSFEVEWGERCKEHRKPFVEKALRKMAVVNWVESNWESYEKKVLEEKSKVENNLHYQQLLNSSLMGRHYFNGGTNEKTKKA